MMEKFGECKVCKKESFIVNRTRYLCNECNYKRLHGGKTRQEVYLEKSQNRPVKKYVLVPRKSKKQRMLDMELAKVYAEIKAEREYKCTGCGSIYGLEHSHLVPRSENRGLVADKRNITYHCRSCHEKWESPTERVNMPDYERNMKVIYEIDRNYFNEIIGKQELSSLLYKKRQI